jgi:uncharacterized protein
VRTDVPTQNILLILHAILEEYVLSWDGDHGIAHWSRVLENGLRLAEETGANIEVVQLSAILHDSERVNEGGDPDHGPRAAAFALDLRGCCSTCLITSSGSCTIPVPGTITNELIPMSRSRPAGMPTGSILVGSASPRTRAASTDAAKHPDILKWADGRASFGVIPEFVRTAWGIDLGRSR